jgi:hypothetical protein
MLKRTQEGKEKKEKGRRWRKKKLKVIMQVKLHHYSK